VKPSSLTHLRSRLRTLLPFALIFGAVLGAASSAQRSTYTFTSTLDDGSPGTLRAAVNAARLTPVDDTIVFDETVFAAPRKTITMNGTSFPGDERWRTPHRRALRRRGA
jgi:hypothetical protein